MALAYLLKTLMDETSNASDSTRLHALVIDHNARRNSHREALAVSAWLEKMGISSTVDVIDWKGQSPTQMTNFESEARTKRYNQLASLARTNGIGHLFTGHHLDDQLETLLMRLIRGDNPSLLALRGMLSPTVVPECESLRGVHNAEPSVSMESIFRQDIDIGLSETPPHMMAIQETRLGQKLYTCDGAILGLRHGGIALHRPFLQFTKDALVATCEANGVPYVKDKTNDDPAFTRRNAIRVLRSRHKLPHALQDPSLLRLSQTARDTLQVISSRASKLLRGISILTFDFRSGVAYLRIPTSFASLVEEDNNVAAYIVAKLSSLVSSTSADKQEALAPGSITSLLWKSLSDRFWYAPGNLRPPKFTYNGVLFEGLHGLQSVVGNSTIWRLSRAPLTSQERELLCPGFRPSGNPNNSTSPWLLWDHRFWIRIHLRLVSRTHLFKGPATDMMKAIRIRPYHIDDAPKLKAVMREKDWKKLQSILHQCAAGKTRYTLPVLTFNGQVVAFPTLSKFLVCANECQSQIKSIGFGDSSFTWEVAYKLLPKDVSQWGSNITMTPADAEAAREHPGESSHGSFGLDTQEAESTVECRSACG
ncbi:tRNA(Ile)-lysidine synthetase [Cyphellophora europaea CBS 101466]|uniref:tRNA(Ile)-lysidine synthetase n=1 Tax=Cyphellophora europaea (strain CBS 101466) TaxID=1220924 RepID=W2S2P6_CYPE1|nr:tRNA(Ile)-lysidine synthetase [Cyphellophora europaea CBS 101466]ETN42239.1 tRNA(Ile)-lysidine synthetase [Cyphellophora europaea CBS 101466]